MAEMQKFRVHLIYKADGMRRPLSFRQAIPAVSVGEAVQLATRFIETAYESGFKVLTWSCENLSKPVEVKYIGGEFADEVSEEEDGDPLIRPLTGFDLFMGTKYARLAPDTPPATEEKAPRTDLGR